MLTLKVPRDDQHQINMGTVSLQLMITKGRLPWSLKEFSQLMKEENVVRSAWRICLWILRLKGVKCYYNTLVSLLSWYHFLWYSVYCIMLDVQKINSFFYEFVTTVINLCIHLLVSENLSPKMTRIVKIKFTLFQDTVHECKWMAWIKKCSFYSYTIYKNNGNLNFPN